MGTSSRARRQRCSRKQPGGTDRWAEKRARQRKGQTEGHQDPGNGDLWVGISQFCPIVALYPARVIPRLHVSVQVCVCARVGGGSRLALCQGLFKWLWNSAPRTDGLRDKAAWSLDRARPRAVAMAGQAPGVCSLSAMRVPPTNVKTARVEGSPPAEPRRGAVLPECRHLGPAIKLAGARGHRLATG